MKAKKFQGEAHLRKTILLVDDSSLVRTLYGELLLTAGYNVIEAADGFDALRLAIENRNIDLVVTDYQMPGKNGLEVARWFLQYRPEAAVMLISASQGPLDTTTKELPWLTCLFKTSGPASVLTCVSRLLSSKAGPVAIAPPEDG